MNLALFDFDHTITSVDTYSRFLRRVATPQQLARARWRVGPWLLGYRAGVVSAQRLRALVTRLTFAGRDAGEVVAEGERFAAESLSQWLRPEMMVHIARHRDAGDTIVIVSASLDAYLQPWCAANGLALLCNRLESRDGRLSGRYLGGDCGAHKVARIRAHYDLDAYPTIFAYGDSREDRPMLALAQRRWYRGRWLD